MTGVLTEMQTKTVSMLPMLSFSEIGTMTTSFDLQNREVVYVVKLKKNRSIKEPKFFRIIEESIWALLGDDWRMTFKVFGRRGVLYGGSPRVRRSTSVREARTGIERADAT